LHDTSDVSPARFAALASRVARGIARLERDEICCGDLTLQQFETLRTLQASGPLTLGAAARSLGIDLSTASRNLGLLVKRGYLKRARGKDDARRVSFALSKKGAGCLDSLCCDERLVFAAVFARVPPERRAAVTEALEVLATALAERPAEQPAAPCCAPGKTCG
jgi:DNA-binding MarR family transcriptional regulator